MDNKHVSEEERTKNVLIYALIGILIAIFIIIIIIIIPKGNNEEEGKVYSSEVLEKQKQEVLNSVDTEEEIKRDKDKVTITVRSVTQEGAVIVITDKNDVEYEWYPRYTIEKRVDEKWEELKVINLNEMIFKNTPMKSDNGVIKQSLAWSDKYGTLEEGEYRIVKEADGIKFYGRFTID